MTDSDRTSTIYYSLIKRQKYALEENTDKRWVNITILKACALISIKESNVFPKRKDFNENFEKFQITR